MAASVNAEPGATTAREATARATTAHAATAHAATATRSGRVNGPLAGIRILDLTAVVLGPLATRILGDYGAEVIKIEPIEGDIMRANGVTRHPGMSSNHLALNRNKRSLAINLKKPEGLEVAVKLLPGADVLVHNMRVPAVDALGLGYEAVSKVNPRIVYCAATGFGQDGPDRAKPAFDDIIQAACGLASLGADRHGTPDYVPTLIADKTAGMAVVNSVLAALFYRERTGRGQYVEVPMFETLVDFTMAEHLGGLSFVPPTAPPGYARILAGGRKPSPTRDGYVAILPYNYLQWEAFFRRIGRENLIAQHDFSSRQKLNARVRELYDVVAKLTPERTTAEWLALCEELDIACTQIYGLDQLFEHPHLKAVGMFERVEHPTEGSIVEVRPATRFSESPAGIGRSAPNVGEHTVEILGELGYDSAQVDALLARGVVGAHAQR